jgi:hypothetical protein
VVTERPGGLVTIQRVLLILALFTLGWVLVFIAIGVQEVLPGGSTAIGSIGLLMVFGSLTWWWDE